MDIIKHGDFSITNTNNRTTFSFRTPSIQEIDYVKESKKYKKYGNLPFIIFIKMI